VYQEIIKTVKYGFKVLVLNNSAFIFNNKIQPLFYRGCKIEHLLVLLNKKCAVRLKILSIRRVLRINVHAAIENRKCFLNFIKITWEKPPFGRRVEEYALFNVCLNLHICKLEQGVG
ncbi:hypothetical protein NQ317_003822, partial [Molorchus minor]